ncbi:hypothetical protein MP228_013071 [Amoeboaphelidium protococcarum]|nr:hypothetical protein MP228_013071 [Amoeboaphelidium protococcarum]
MTSKDSINSRMDDVDVSPTITHISNVSSQLMNTQLDSTSDSQIDAPTVKGVASSDKNGATGDDVVDTQPEHVAVEDASSYGKMKAIFSIMTKFIGVKDMVGLRISLPSQLLDPISNLEFWNYMDCPDLFTCIKEGDQLPIYGADIALTGDSELDRMLRVVRWWFSKDVKFIVNDKLMKPYNSILGEQFICWYDIQSRQHLQQNGSLKPQGKNDNNRDDDDDDKPLSQVKQSMTVSTDDGDAKCRVWSVTEQISHHPPVSAYYHYCPEKKIVARGVDHISAKFSGTSVKIFPGHLNKGIFVDLLPDEKFKQCEEYVLSHPSAFVNGWLKFSLWIAVNGYCVIRCPQSGLCCLIEYKDEPFFGKAKFAIEAKIFKYDAQKYQSNDDVINAYSGKGKVPDDKVLCVITGSWKEELFYQMKSASGQKDLDKHCLINLSKLKPAVEIVNSNADAPAQTAVPAVKKVRQLEQQDAHESRKLWEKVSSNIIGGQFSEATKLKRELEDKQRAEGKERKQKNQVYESFWFGFLNSDGGNVISGADDEHGNKKSDGNQSKQQAVGGSSLKLHVEDKSLASVELEGKPFLVQKRLDDCTVPWMQYLS